MMVQVEVDDHCNYDKALAALGEAYNIELCMMVQVEVDDYCNYDKALAALGEAYNILCKSPEADDTYRVTINELHSQMTLIKAYLDAIQYAAKQNVNSVSVLMSLVHIECFPFSVLSPLLQTCQP